MTYKVQVHDLHQNLMQELKNEDIVNSVHVPTEKNLADMLTKGLSAEVRQRLEKCLSGIAEAIATDEAAKEDK